MIVVYLILVVALATLAFMVFVMILLRRAHEREVAEMRERIDGAMAAERVERELAQLPAGELHRLGAQWLHPEPGRLLPERKADIVPLKRSAD